VGNFIIGFEFHVEVSQGHLRKVFRRFWWHSTLGAGCITSSGYVLQPNIQEREFGRYAPTLEDLDPAKVRNWYNDMVRVAHDFGIYLPAYEEYRPEETFSVIECGDTRTARLPSFCRSQMSRWQAIIHHHLKRDKVIPSSHPTRFGTIPTDTKP